MKQQITSYYKAEYQNLKPYEVYNELVKNGCPILPEEVEEALEFIVQLGQLDDYLLRKLTRETSYEKSRLK